MFASWRPGLGLVRDPQVVRTKKGAWGGGTWPGVSPRGFLEQALGFKVLLPQSLRGGGQERLSVDGRTAGLALGMPPAMLRAQGSVCECV